MDKDNSIFGKISFTCSSKSFGILYEVKSLIIIFFNVKNFSFSKKSLKIFKLKLQLSRVMVSIFGILNSSEIFSTLHFLKTNFLIGKIPTKLSSLVSKTKVSKEARFVLLGKIVFSFTRLRKLGIA